MSMTDQLNRIEASLMRLHDRAEAPREVGLDRREVADLVQNLLLHMEHDRKIDALRAHRELTGWGLKDSKDAVEHHMRLIDDGR